MDWRSGYQGLKGSGCLRVSEGKRGEIDWFNLRRHWFGSTLFQTASVWRLWSLGGG